MSELIQRIDLYYTNAAEHSDKTFVVVLIRDDEGWRVDCANGKRDGTLKLRPKGAGLSEAAAQKLFQGIVKEKARGGYTTDVSGTPFAGVTLQGGSPHASASLPSRKSGQPADGLDRGLMLLSVVDRTQMLSLSHDPRWRFEQKMDGERRPIRRAGTTVTGYNRTRQAVAFSSRIQDAFLALDASNFVIDGEQIGDVYYAFDLLELAGSSVEHQPLRVRLTLLNTVLNGANPQVIQRPLAAESTTDKQDLFARIEGADLEGVVGKDLDAPYEACRSRFQVKFKFHDTATVWCDGQNGAKRSVGISCLDAKGQRRSIGNVTIPANVSMPERDTFIEVRYLYRVGDGDLFQPVFDKHRPDCTEQDVARVGDLKQKPAEQTLHAA